ncbi:Transposase IS116/IS110/IS902 family protein [Thiorhodovibrio winogradskyi]|uniref:Transposase IS116/IS110/IS902 family protein n=1 Tax=Thiorhodovibrio winogradskyi TaxID=77007 RepID=A0ABZ0S884_9GAMM|nr:IS110 family transposase [Thiorhodovibrio winogradskyi]
MTTAAVQTPKTTLYLALELSNKTWKLCFSNGEKIRIKTIEARDLPALREQIEIAQGKLGLSADCVIESVYEAGRDGFWIHRILESWGIHSRVVDSASIQVNRKKRRVKTDRVDVEALLVQLMRYLGGEKKALAVVNVPSAEAEDRMRVDRERERLIHERGAHSSRMKSLFVAQGLVIERLNDSLIENLDHLCTATGEPLGADLKEEIRREYQRYCLADEQIRAIEQEQKRRVEQATDAAYEQIARMLELKGIGWVSSWVLVMEFFSWRGFRNRQQLAACAGLTPTPYASGDDQRDQGISKAGNRRIRALMVELSWLWLRYQPDSALSRWYRERFAKGGKRMRRIGIVALARKLLIALWRYLEQGEIPDGAVLKAG